MSHCSVAPSLRLNLLFLQGCFIPCILFRLVEMFSDSTMPLFQSIKQLRMLDLSFVITLVFVERKFGMVALVSIFLQIQTSYRSLNPIARNVLRFNNAIILVHSTITNVRSFICLNTSLCRAQVWHGNIGVDILANSNILPIFKSHPSIKMVLWKPMHP